ncbi:hypothetical protein Tco_1554129 [Tanacetum coccineum]
MSGQKTHNLDLKDGPLVSQIHHEIFNRKINNFGKSDYYGDSTIIRSGNKTDDLRTSKRKHFPIPVTISKVYRLCLSWHISKLCNIVNGKESVSLEVLFDRRSVISDIEIVVHNAVSSISLTSLMPNVSYRLSFPFCEGKWGALVLPNVQWVRLKACVIICSLAGTSSAFCCLV